MRAGEVDWPTKAVVLVDIDGTLSNPQHRLWKIRGPGRKNWNKFFAACDRDPPVEAVVRWTRALAEDRTVCIAIPPSSISDSDPQILPQSGADRDRDLREVSTDR